MKRLWNALKYSLHGLKAAITTERAFQEEIFVSCILVPLALLIPVSLFLKVALIVCNIIVLITELLNSSVEAVVDMVSPDYHELAKRAKDCGSAAVLLSLTIWFIMWAFTFYKLFCA